MPIKTIKNEIMIGNFTFKFNTIFGVLINVTVRFLDIPNTNTYLDSILAVMLFDGIKIKPNRNGVDILDCYIHTFN